MSQQIGHHAEQLIADYLVQQGLELIAQNYHSRYGEIDVIVRDGNTLCFIEVKARRLKAQVGASESVNRSKQRKTIKTAQFFLQKHPQFEDLFCRFDVFTLEYSSVESFNQTTILISDQTHIHWEWIQDAYQLE